MKSKSEDFWVVGSESSIDQLQSVNGEATDINHELEHNIDETNRINSDLLNLIRANDIASIFLDRQLKIKRYTPHATEIFRLVPTDIGKPLAQVKRYFSTEDFLADAEKSLTSPHVFEHEIALEDKRIFSARFAPYYSDNDEIDGVVLTFFNITESKSSEEAFQKLEERFRLILECITDYAVITTDINGIINGWNTGAVNAFGWTSKEIIGKSCEILFTPEDRQSGSSKRQMQISLENGIAHDRRWHIRKDGTRFFASGTVSPIISREFEGFIKITSDQTARVEADKVRREKEMLQKLVRAQEDERRRIARDLHDELGQQLTALRLKLEDIKNSCENSDDLCAKIDAVQLVAKSLDDGVDFLAWELRPAALDDLGLYAALNKYANEWSRYAGIAMRLLPSNIKKVRFEPQIETNLYRIAQEAINNTHKHARASEVEIQLERRSGQIILIIADDGIGFDPNSKKLPTTGIGLIGMQERAALIDGTLQIESAPGQGTTIFVRVPDAHPQREISNE